MSDPIEEELRSFCAKVLIDQPFYGDILLRLPVLRDDGIPTACTDGRAIRWNGAFFQRLTPPQRHYVLMHEVFHTLLGHPLRMQRKNRAVWNVAADILVNHMCDMLTKTARFRMGLDLERPPDGVYRETDSDETLENLYGRILADNRKAGKRYMLLRTDYRHRTVYVPGKGLQEAEAKLEEIPWPAGDLLPGGKDGIPLTPEEEEALTEEIRALLREAGRHSRGMGKSVYIPRKLLMLTRAKPLDWRKILKEFLSEVQSDETSYTTPERKYLHMDLIVPGHGLKEEGELESVWAFVDSSGSVGREDLSAFLTQLYRIVKEFRCEMNIAYWDASVTDVYEKLRNPKKVLEAQPKHSGGTDINCVYRFVQERHLKPLVSLILTDGYFGVPDPQLRRALPKKSTVLLLCNSSENAVYDTVGRVCRLKEV